MNQDPSNKALIAAIISAAAIIIAAIISLGVPFVENWAAESSLPSTPIDNSIPSPQIIVVTATMQSQLANPPTATHFQVQPANLCFGQCWEYDDNNRIMTWIRLADGTEDIWQPSGSALEKIRSGYTAIITTSVPGEIFACILTINGETVKSSCDGVLYQLPPGTYQVTSSNNSIGGFRWCPLVGYGWRANGGECK